MLLGDFFFFFSLRDQGNTSEEEIIHICPSATKTVVCFSSLQYGSLSSSLITEIEELLLYTATAADSVLWFSPYQSDFNLTIQRSLVQSSAEFGGPSLWTFANFVKLLESSTDFCILGKIPPLRDLG